jgi:uncharacterized protein (TIGR02217 family)
MIIIADTSEIFPACPTFGFIAEPNYLVKITAREGGYERRQRIWSRPLIKFSTVPMGDQAQADIEQVLYFWHAMGGMSYGFRFKDWTDYKSCLLDNEPAATDQPLVATGDSPASYRLVKQYVFGSMIQQREITRPIASSISIANDVGAVQTAWTLDESTGLVTIDSGFTGVPTSWGGEFYVWCRFDAQMNPAFSNYQILNVSLQLAEIRMPLA